MDLLKDRYFQEPFIRTLCKNISDLTTHFDSDFFMGKLLAKSFTSLELKDKLRGCALVIGESFTLDYLESVEVLKKIAPNFDDFDSMVFPEFVDVYGQDYFEESLDALAFLTQYGSSEFAIRSFARRDTERVLDYMHGLASHRHEYVRRFASEGCRPKLPWAMSVKSLNDEKNLHKIMAILEILKEDESLFVRKSVANNLNDISKLDSALVLSTAQKWIGQNDHTDWILKHGLRTLLKKGNKEALALWGLDNATGVDVISLHLENDTLHIGDTSYLVVSFTVAMDKKLRGAFNVHYLKKNASHSIKTFAFFEKEFKPGTYTIKKKISFREMSTRKHYAGQHMIDMVVNGEDKMSLAFDLGDEL